MHDLPLITTIAAAFTAAWVLGIITQKLKLSPIVGYLLAGVVIGPYTPGFVGDAHLASQLAEIGVILLMFGVGLHFHLKDLLAVKKVAIPGAVIQSLAATLMAVVVAMAFGWPLKSGVVLGIAMSVASTVVLLRVLLDNNVLDTPQGHLAVGWLIVEDILTVIVLVLVPAMAATGTGAAAHGLWATLLIALLKLAALVVVLLLGGSRVIPWIMVKVAQLRSHELFTLTVLVMSIAIAVGSAYVFGASMALGAFLAGMVVGQSPVSNQAAADALPLRDAFAVLFFTSVGMLFDPRFVLHHPGLMMCGLSIVIIVKPLVAFLIVAVMGHSLRTAITVAFGLAQVGEFSFIVADLGRQHGLMDDTAYHLLVACALVSITLNPLLFRLIDFTEAAIQKRPMLSNLFKRREKNGTPTINPAADRALEQPAGPLAIILGYGPVGKTIDVILRESDLQTVVVDLNMSTIESLTRQGRAAIFGDAYNMEVMHKALAGATHLIITLPHSTHRNPLITSAKSINPRIKIFVRTRYVSEREELAQFGADVVCCEEVEISVALAQQVLQERGADPQAIQQEILRIRETFNLPTPPA